VADPVGVAASGSEDDGVTSGETLGSACSLSLAHGDALSNGRLVHDADAAAASALEVAGTIPSIPLDCRMPSDTACGAAASRGLWGRGGRGGTAATAASDSTETARCTPSSSEPRRPFGVSLIIPMTSEAVTSPAEPCSSAVNSPVAEIATPTAGNSQATARTTAGQRKRAGSQRCIAIVKLCLRGHFTRTACRPPLNATVANTEVTATQCTETAASCVPMSIANRAMPEMRPIPTQSGRLTRVRIRCPRACGNARDAPLGIADRRARRAALHGDSVAAD
jgi:hypothetical protein